MLSTHLTNKRESSFLPIATLRHRARAQIMGKVTIAWGPLYWESLEDILVCCKDKLTILHLFDALYASLFFYYKCSNLIQALCETQLVPRLQEDDCQVIFNELRVAKGQRTETPPAAFISCWLCTFILLIRNASCICPGSFSVISFIASGVGLVALVKPSHFNSKRPENSLVLGGAFAGTHPSSTDLKRPSWMMAGCRELTFIRLSFFSYRYEDNLIMEHYCPYRFSMQFSFHQDGTADLNLDNFLDLEIMTCCHPRAHTLWNKVSGITSWAMRSTREKYHSCISRVVI
ncbi:hypothetical protein Cgig2_002216 [Carnegiea gigantea]|uniref:Uncharacterized protein n=1 Tax=Carnegiea gigantea TaxID=171969 RepID=A0A9Q1GXG6_9CARY|nr:hypothetical protein Cgig2_002216 [Carnegiea gigantea]